MAWDCHRSPSVFVERLREISRTWHPRFQRGRSGTKIGRCRNGTYESREGELKEEEVGCALVATNLSQSDGAGFVAMGLGARNWVAG